MQNIFIFSAEAKKSHLLRGEFAMGISEWVEGRATLLVDVAHTGRQSEDISESWPRGLKLQYMCMALKRGNSEYPASQFIAYHVFQTPPHSENAIKLMLYSLPTCSLKVKHACAIWIYSEPLNKCVKDIPRG